MLEPPEHNAHGRRHLYDLRAVRTAPTPPPGEGGWSLSHLIHHLPFGHLLKHRLALSCFSALLRLPLLHLRLRLLLGLRCAPVSARRPSTQLKLQAALCHLQQPPRHLLCLGLNNNHLLRLLLCPLLLGPLQPLRRDPSALGILKRLR
jgi:hypothetical protein